MPAIPSTWLTEFVVNLTATGTQARPRVVHLANGNILVIWDSTDNTGAGVQPGVDVIGQIFDPLGVRIGGEFAVNASFTADDERNADVAALASGGFVTVYEDFDVANNNRSIRLTERAADGTTPVTVTIIADASNNADPTFFNPRVASSSNTSVLVVYQEEEIGGDSRIVGKIYDSVANTVGPVISLINSLGPDTNPSVTVLNNGNYVIAASTDDPADTSSSISYRIITATGVNVLSVTQITGTDTDADNDREAGVTALTGGGFVITWTNTDLNDTDIKAQRFNGSGVAQGSVINVGDGGATDNNNEPAVVALLDGGFIVFYDDDVAGELRGSRYDSAGALVSGQFVISAGGGGIDEIDAELLDDGRVAVSFERADGEIGMEIIDVRDVLNVAGVYAPDTHIIGTIGNDTFTATAAENYGHDGNDTITDGVGLNSIFGGAGNDTVTILGVDAGEDVDGGSGDDTVVGDSMVNGTIYNLGAGTVTSGAAVQNVTSFAHAVGTTADETLIGTSFSNSLTGGGGNDTFLGGLNTDTIFGGAGNDLIQVLDGEFFDNVTGGADTDTLDHSAVTRSGDIFDFDLGVITTGFATGTPTLASIEIYQDGSGGNTIISEGNSSTYFGNGGNDTLVATAGGETMFGGAGNDTVDLSVGNFQYDFNTETGIDISFSELFLEFETFIFGSDNDTVITHSDTSIAETVYGGSGNDTLTDTSSTGANATQDSYDGGLGTDTLIYTGLGGGGRIADMVAGILFNAADVRDSFTGFENITFTSGSNNIIGDGGNNRLTTQGDFVNSLFGGDGNDRLDAGEGNDLLDGGNGNDTFFGGDGDDSLLGGADNDVLGLGAGNDFADGGSGNDQITGANGDDDMLAQGGNDTLFGGSGNDTLNGGLGSDSMTGGTGNDTYVINSQLDVITEAAGDTADRVTSSIGVSLALIGVNIENLTLTGLANVDGDGNALANIITGNDFDNLVSGLEGDDTVNGADGNDTVNGGAGNDSVLGGVGNDALLGGADQDNLGGGTGDDSLNGGSGNDTLNGNDGNDALDGSIGNDVLNGAAQNDILLGGGGNDTLTGGAGNDTLTGGSNSDTFVFAGTFGVDQITDFSVADLTERIDLSGLAAITSFADLTANHLSQVGGNSVITSGVNTVTIVGVSNVQLTVNEFIF